MQLVTGAFLDKIQEQGSSIKVILALLYYSVKHTSRILSFIWSLVNIEINIYSTSYSLYRFYRKTHNYYYMSKK